MVFSMGNPVLPDCFWKFHPLGKARISIAILAPQRVGIRLTQKVVKIILKPVSHGLASSALQHSCTILGVTQHSLSSNDFDTKLLTRRNIHKCCTRKEPMKRHSTLMSHDVILVVNNELKHDVQARFLSYLL